MLNTSFDPTLIRDSDNAARYGFRLGDKSTHTSRTMMLTELSRLLEGVGPEGKKLDYRAAVIDENCLGKTTASTRRLSLQRLSELYALDPQVPLFRILRRLFEDPDSRPLLALLASIARDPVLAATAETILNLKPGASLNRDQLTESVRAAVGGRLNDSTLDKVVRNVASTWEQSGHLEGRTFKRRKQVSATPRALTFALFLGYAVGYRGEELLTTPWVAALDITPGRATALAQEARSLGLIDYRAAGDVVFIGLERLDPSLRD